MTTDGKAGPLRGFGLPLFSRPYNGRANFNRGTLTKTETDLMADWNYAFAQVLTRMETADQNEEIARALIDSLRVISPSGRGGAWLFREGFLPVSLYNNISCSNESYYELYARGLYRIDPVRRAGREGFTGCATIRDLAPEDFERSEYWIQMYQERGVIDELTHFLPVPNGSVQLHLARTRGEQLFTSTEVARHRAIFPTLLAALRSFDCFDGAAEENDFSERVEATYVDFGVDTLTAREQEVVRFVLEGHNSESISHALGIATNTVRELRQRAYRKLGVRTQGQLFSRFLERLSSAFGAE